MQDVIDKHPLDIALRRARASLIAVLLFSFCINLLMLTAPLYMLQIYDRVLISRSVDTLLLLTVVAAGALLVFGVLEFLRSRVLIRIGGRFDRDLSKTVFHNVMLGGSGAQPFRDLEELRNFFTGSSLLALFDSPWTPIFIALIYYLHPYLGHVALAGALVLFTIAVINELVTRKPLRDSAQESAQAHQFADASSRNRESVQAMGMLAGLAAVWRRWHDAGISYQSIASDRASIIAGAAKFTRFFIQVAILGVGAYLAINEIITPGVMIAASIISSRALAPVEAAIGGWRNFLLARTAKARLYEFLENNAASVEPMSLPVPKGELVFDNVYATPPEHEKPVLSGVSFRLEAGTSLGITGPSAAGKSSVARLMVGVWQPLSGEVRLDKAELSQWDKALLGPHIGYLPQDVELFDGTVADNIARFGKVESEAVVAAAKLASAHETILGLSEGYETVIGAGGENISGGQRQRIGIARAFYNTPALIVLDEPTSNLDSMGEVAIRSAIPALKQQGSSVVIIAHKPTLIADVDNLMVIQKGALTHFGPTAEVMPQITRRSTIGAVPGTSIAGNR